MDNAYRRHDISDSLWSVISPQTIGNKGTWGGNAKD
ncbi:MAG: IS5/IS1182 family transposase, partial [Defluviitaleaceae bacterium]|nr:IS5/IS1182 family transposase [Defluviitaleaceae bacterium]